MEPTTLNDVVKHLAEAGSLAAAGLAGWVIWRLRQLYALLKTKALAADHIAQMNIAQAEGMVKRVEAQAKSEIARLTDQIVSLGGRDTP